MRFILTRFISFHFYFPLYLTFSFHHFLLSVMWGEGGLCRSSDNPGVGHLVQSQGDFSFLLWNGVFRDLSDFMHQWKSGEGCGIFIVQYGFCRLAMG